ncbi:unnamed protein product [Closterium sp. NIES-54]
MTFLHQQQKHQHQYVDTATAAAAQTQAQAQAGAAAAAEAASVAMPTPAPAPESAPTSHSTPLSLQNDPAITAAANADADAADAAAADTTPATLFVFGSLQSSISPGSSPTLVSPSPPTSSHHTGTTLSPPAANPPGSGQPPWHLAKRQRRPCDRISLVGEAAEPGAGFPTLAAEEAAAAGRVAAAAVTASATEAGPTGLQENPPFIPPSLFPPSSPGAFEQGGGIWAQDTPDTSPDTSPDTASNIAVTITGNNMLQQSLVGSGPADCARTPPDLFPGMAGKPPNLLLRFGEQEDAEPGFSGMEVLGDLNSPHGFWDQAE